MTDQSAICDCDHYDLGEHTKGVCEALRQVVDQEKRKGGSK